MSSKDAWIEIYTDGSYLREPNAGGWAALLIYKGNEKIISGGRKGTTNNKMELYAVLQALEAITRKSNITIYTDSQYVQQGITKWILNWEKNGYKTSQRKPVKNANLWQRLRYLEKEHRVIWNWIKGHNGNPLHDRVDVIARREANRIANN